MELRSALFVFFAQYKVVPLVDCSSLVFGWLQLGCRQSIPALVAVDTALHAQLTGLCSVDSSDAGRQACRR